MVATLFVFNCRSTVGVVTGISQHPAQVNDHLDVNVFVPRAVEGLGLRPKRHLDLAVVFLTHLADVLEQRDHVAPLNVVAGRVTEDLVNGVAVAAG